MLIVTPVILVSQWLCPSHHISIYTTVFSDNCILSVIIGFSKLLVLACYLKLIGSLREHWFHVGFNYLKLLLIKKKWKHWFIQASNVHNHVGSTEAINFCFEGIHMSLLIFTQIKTRCKTEGKAFMTNIFHMFRSYRLNIYCGKNHFT